MKAQEQKVRQYFDAIAKDYRCRYQHANAYYTYFFQERLEAATQGFNFENATVFDIGAGTGALYDYLKSNVQHFEYFACDISLAMLEESNIPRQQYFVGDAMTADLKGRQFDFIFLLGVTSYMSKTAVEELLRFISQHLKIEGKAIVSFAHHRSLDAYLRKVLGYFAKIIKPRKRVIGQSFSSQAYSLSELSPLLPTNLGIEQVVWLNHCFSPFNHLLPRPSVRLAHLLKKYLSHTRIFPFLSADFLVVFSKPSPNKVS